ncbi:pepF/M3 family oligoendopeptidase [Geomicrobium halophilum]|uniref:PepF/M3 family oligoendopeptidase n=1 Tax=Geomicrobium halophilum TaxID=549000 RepID=A0A841PNZ8_9BACL|nr:M3 family oligoendopeptidase [Geomicrobium halophilum]MBB6450557.1 pepF/M3 family oligoendopeptidase [Geomicrobium halophilum]
MSKLQWNLGTVFAGGHVNDSSFQSFVSELKIDLKKLREKVETLSEGDIDNFTFSFIQLEDLTARFQEASAFTTCLVSANIKDQEAKQWRANLKPILGQLQSIDTELEDHLLHMKEEEWQNLMSHPDMKARSFPLHERRQKGREKMEKTYEQLAEALSQDGYHGWSDMYDTLIAQMRITKDDETLSVGQANNKKGSSDRAVRKKWAAALEEKWEDHEDLFAEAINHLSGFRLALYEKRGWSDPLKEPLMINRMQSETLDAMWAAIEEVKPMLVMYLRRKKALLGIDKLHMHDISAPIGDNTKEIPYEEAAQDIEAHFRSFSPIMADFAREAFDKNWIEAEDRDHKRPGGFCTTFPVSGQSRIFMTYDGTSGNVQTLAHELGHAFHQRTMEGLPYFTTRYAMNVAETASTFAEQIMADAAVKEASSRDEKIKLLDTKINRSCAFFMNIHARFLFEKRFYERRKQGWVNPDELKHLMVESQKEAYCGELDVHDPYFWSSKLHFFITRTPFYNFPYTFGYLFSLGIYQRSKQNQEDFETAYISLLKDSAAMTVEELAEHHLGVDLTRKDFWRQAAQPIIEDIETFLELTE